MFRVYVKYKNVEYPLYEPLDNSMRILEPVLTEGMGSAGSFVFLISLGHPNYDKIKPCKSEIILYQDDEVLFCGRLYHPEQDFNNIVTVTCEGDLTYLLDSIQRPFAFSGNMESYISKLLEVHNSQVEPDKQVEIGNVIVGADVTVERTLTEFTATLTVMRQMMDDYGGYYRFRRAGGKRYLDYVWDYGGINDQIIRFGENLLDLTKHVDASQIITCLIPQGGTVEYQDELGEKQTKPVDITSVNDGKDYIEDTAAIEKYGRIWGVQGFQDVTDPQKLLEKAKAYLEEAAALPETVEISAVDLSLINANVTAFRVGYWTDVSSAPHRIERKFLLSKREINLLDPTQGSITLGRPPDTLTGNANRTQAAISHRVDQIAKDMYDEMARKVENATNLITGGLGGYVVLDNVDPVTGEKIHPWRILIMNTPDKATAKNVIQINQNGIGFSTTGINGPYRNAWTIDGNLVADFITTGTLLADRVRGGTLEVGGSGLGRDGRIVVKDASDNQIGYWDNTGLHILRGVIKGTDFIGGTIDIGDGTFEVDRDGAVTIESGEINIGNTRITPNYMWMGDFGVSSGNAGLFYSRDSGETVQISTNKKNAWLAIGVTVQYSGAKTVYGAGGIVTSGDIYFKDPWTEEMSALDMFKDLYKKIRDLKS